MSERGGEGVCVWITTTFLIHEEKDPFGIDSAFYTMWSLLMVCGLLVMVCDVIAMNLKTRRRDQSSQKSRRVAAQPYGMPEILLICYYTRHEREI